jgi:hypothetical protein
MPFVVDPTSEPGILRLELSGALTTSEMAAFVEQHNRAIDAFGRHDYRVFCDIRQLAPLSPACAALFEKAKAHSAGKKNFRGSAVLVSSAPRQHPAPPHQRGERGDGHRAHHRRRGGVPKAPRRRSPALRLTKRRSEASCRAKGGPPRAARRGRKSVGSSPKRAGEAHPHREALVVPEERHAHGRLAGHVAHRREGRERERAGDRLVEQTRRLQRGREVEARGQLLQGSSRAPAGRGSRGRPGGLPAVGVR